ncbi:thioredoxin-like protein [Melampsora americana]|nr:thioredoxin-like protein [Melampsora americana]
MTPSTLKSKIIELKSLNQLNQLIQHSNQLIIIDFHAKWCPPCHAIAPFYEDLSKTYSNLIFTKCDTDECKPIAESYKITAMPTFIFIKNKQKVEEIKGANRAGIEAAIKRYSSDSGTSHHWGKGGHRLGDSNGQTSNQKPRIDVLNLNRFDQLSSHVKLGIGLVLIYLCMIYFQ